MNRPTRKELADQTIERLKRYAHFQKTGMPPRQGYRITTRLRQTGDVLRRVEIRPLTPEDGK